MDFIKLLIASHIYLMLLGTEIFKMLLAGFIMVACMWLVGFIAIWIVRDFKTAYNGIKPTKVITEFVKDIKVLSYALSKTRIRFLRKYENGGINRYVKT